jgi:hypothetical protein
MSCGSNDTETRNIMRVRGRKADCVWGEGVLGTTRDVISKPCLKRERIYFRPALNPPFCQYKKAVCDLEAVKTRNPIPQLPSTHHCLFFL